MEKWKWLVRGASLLIVIGFFMPAVLVSCNSVYFEQPIQSYSLADIAGMDTPVLYIVPLLSIVAIGFSLLQGRGIIAEPAVIWAQLLTIILQILTIVITIFSLFTQVRKQTFDTIKVTPTFGTYFLCLSAVLYVIFWINLKKTSTVTSKPVQSINEYQYSPRVDERPISQEFRPLPLQDQIIRPVLDTNKPLSRLIVLTGDLPTNRIIVSNDRFTIGRSSSNQLQLEDPAVSRYHAVLRFSQGMWFLQDTDSSGGTFVNGIRTDATRLNSGDEIAVGSYKFKFLLDE